MFVCVCLCVCVFVPVRLCVFGCSCVAVCAYVCGIAVWPQLGWPSCLARRYAPRKTQRLCTNRLSISWSGIALKSAWHPRVSDAVLCQCVFACVFACVREVLVARLGACACCWRRLARAPHNDADRGVRQSAGALKFVANCWLQRFIFEVQFWS